jgi:serpin B
MMKQSGSFAYLRGKDFRAIELPYAGGELAMLVLLPDRKDGLEEFEKTLTAANVSDWLARLRPRDIELYLPRFQTTYSVELRERLIGMGMPLVFGLDADFSGMTGQRNFHLSAIMHRAYVAVNEDGTEAAAATAALVERSTADMVVFRVDRPFVFLLRDTRTGSVLFLGRLVQP